MKVGVLGGGLTGLSLSNFLGPKAEIIEKNSETGGLCRSLCDEGFTFDYGGSHIIFSRDNEVLKFMLNSLGNNKVQRIRNTKILYNGLYIKYPFENGLCDLPKEDNYECLLHYINAVYSHNNDLSPQNFREWIYYTFGKGIAEKYMIPYNEKIWNTKTELMATEWIKDRVPKPPLEDVIKSSLGIRTEGYIHQLYFFYPKTGGIHSLIKSIQRKNNNTVTTGFSIKSIKKEDGKWIISNNSEDKVFDEIISTIPLQEIKKSLKKLPETVVKAIDDLKFNSLITVMIGLDNPKINDLSWLYIPQNDIRANRVSFPSNFSEFVVPMGKSSVLAEITCKKTDDLWNQKETKIADIIIEELDKLQIINKDEVIYHKVKKMDYAYIIYDLDYSRNMSIINRYFCDLGIRLCGRFSEFMYLNMDGCIRSAINMANALNNGSL